MFFPGSSETNSESSYVYAYFYRILVPGGTKYDTTGSLLGETRMMA